MSQKTLLSFFSVKPNKQANGDSTVKSPVKEDKCSLDDSPVKTTNKKKRQRISSSSSENSDKEDESKKKLDCSPAKKSFINKLAKFSASPRKDRSAENNTVKNEEKTEKMDNEEKTDEKKLESEIKESEPDSKKEKKEKKAKEKKKRKSSPVKETEEEEIINLIPSKKPRQKKEEKSPSPAKESKKKSPSPAKEKSPSPAKEAKKKSLSPAKEKSPSPAKETKKKSLSPAKEKSPSPAKETKKKSPSKSKEKAQIKNFFTSTSSSKEKSKTGDSGRTYNPNNPKYHPIDHACWKHGEKIPYFALARTFEEIEGISARLKMIEILSNFLRSVIVLTPDDFLACVYLSLNRICPAHEGLELGLAEQTLIRAISQSTGRTFTQIKNEVKEVGDLGLVAERSRSSQKLMFQPAPLTIQGIFKKFKEIANLTGKSTIDKKISMILSLYVACEGPEARFLIRSLNGKLRIGLAEQSVLQAIAQACATTPPGQSYPPENINMAKGISAETFKSQVEELALILKTTYCECPNYDLIVPIILEKGIKELPNHCKITPGLPLKPMLAQPTKGVQEVLTRFENMEFTCEWKYDGERAQIHYAKDGTVKIYSRNQEDNTSKYPDVISRLKNTMKEGVTSFILDCEAVAWDRAEKKILPFQILSTRKRKDANEADIKVQVNVFMFDLLYLNEKSLVKEPFFERRRLLHENFDQIEGEWSFATAIDTSKMEEVQEFLEESIKGNCEGLMVKTLKEEATYEIAKRSRNWLKLKKDYLEGVGDSLDLVVLGGYLGKGKRTGTYGGFLVGCYDHESEEYQSICKLGTGFSDEALATHTEFFKNHIIPNAPAYYQYDSSLEPDHWFEPVQVWETKCADLSLSPIHRAGMGLIDPEKGISLRFPRFLRIREDKKPEDATTALQVAELYKSQDQVKNQQKQSKFNEEDFY